MDRARRVIIRRRQIADGRVTRGLSRPTYLPGRGGFYGSRNYAAESHILVRRLAIIKKIATWRPMTSVFFLCGTDTPGGEQSHTAPFARDDSFRQFAGVHPSGACLRR